MTNTISTGPFLSTVSAAQRPDPQEVAAKVQSMFMELMLKAMEDSVEAEDGLFGNSASSDIYRGMLREHLAGAISQAIKSPLQDVLGDALTPASAPVTKALDSRPMAESLPDVRPPARSPNLPVNGVITSPEGWRRDPINGQTRYHAGTDIAAPAGTPVRAVAGGRVIESGSKGGYGNTVVIETEDGHKMLYAHNSQNLVRVGDRVVQGEPIAEVGSTGRATGPHVHFEIKF
jgi:murein DD-endopeptidase MepM/ murein hydrolase activator NlpD